MKKFQALVALGGLLLASAGYAQSAITAGRVEEGKVYTKLDTTIASNTNLNTAVEPDKNLAIRVAPGASGNTSATLFLLAGSTIISRSTLALAPAGDGVTLNFAAPLHFNSFTISATSIGGSPTIAATQVK